VSIALSAVHHHSHNRCNKKQAQLQSLHRLAHHQYPQLLCP
jgi:hypothetical protein